MDVRILTVQMNSHGWFAMNIGSLPKTIMEDYTVRVVGQSNTLCPADMSWPRTAEK